MHVDQNWMASGKNNLKKQGKEHEEFKWTDLWPIILKFSTRERDKEFNH